MLGICVWVCMWYAELPTHIHCTSDTHILPRYHAHTIIHLNLHLSQQKLMLKFEKKEELPSNAATVVSQSQKHQGDPLQI